MADTTPTPAPGVVQTVSAPVIAAVSGVWGFLVWFISLFISFIPVGWRKYVAGAALILGGFWFAHAYLEWSLPSVPDWKAICPAPVQKVSTLPPLSIYTDISTLKGNQNVMETRLKALESARMATQVPPAPAVVPKAKPVKKATQNAGDSSYSLFAP